MVAAKFSTLRAHVLDYALAVSQVPLMQILIFIQMGSNVILIDNTIVLTLASK